MKEGADERAGGFGMKAGDRFSLQGEGETWHVVRSARREGPPFVAEVEIAAGRGPPRHYHRDEDETLEVLRGTLHCVLPDGVRTLRPGERLLVEKGTPHRIFAGKDGPVLVRASYGGMAFEETVAQLWPGDKAAFLRMARHLVATGFAGSMLTNPFVRGFVRAVAAVGAVLGVQARDVATGEAGQDDDGAHRAA